jgi:hypothetical protein
MTQVLRWNLAKPVRGRGEERSGEERRGEERRGEERTT